MWSAKPGDLISVSSNTPESERLTIGLLFVEESGVILVKYTRNGVVSFAS